MPDCPLADDCPQFSERINGLGCQHYGDKGGAEWCDHYERPIYELKSQPVKVGEEVVVEVTDIHESGAGVGRTDDGFIILVDGILPDARAKVRIKRVKSNHALGEEVERLPWDEDEETDGTDAEGDDDDAETADDDADEQKRSSGPKRPEALGSRDNFWGS
jgi:predicted RNA-binding protein with TRAM domain